MAVARAERTIHPQAVPPRPRDDGHGTKPRSVRDWLDLGLEAARSALRLVVQGVEIGKELPVRVKSHGFTVKGTAVISRMSAEGSEFAIKIRDRVWGKKICKDVSVAVDRKPGGGYTFTKVEDGKVERGDVRGFRVDGPVTRLSVPDASKGRLTEIQFTDYGNGRFRIRGEDFSADFNA